MPQMTPGQARVIDPVLSTVAQGYRNAAAIGQILFPFVPVGQRGGKIITFGKEDFQLYATGRAPGGNTKRVQYGYAGSNYALENHSLEGMVPFELMEEAEAVPGINLGTGAVMKTQNIISNRLEIAQATLATTASNYPVGNKNTLAGTGQWSDFASGVSDPIADVDTAKEAVRQQTGREPNTVVMGSKVFNKVKRHPKIVELIKYTGRDVVTPEILAGLFDVERVVVGKGVYQDGAGAMQDTWGKFVIVAFTETASLAEMGLPTYGYTYRLTGCPIVESPYQDRNAKSWVYPVNDDVIPVIAASIAGYLYSAVVA